MRMEEKKRRMNIILGIILQIYFLFPWMNITGERKNFIMYVIAVLRNHSCADTYNTTFLDGAADALPLDIHTLAKTFTVCVMLYVVLEVIETIRLICNIKGWEIKFLSIIELIGLFAMLSVVAEIGLNSSWSSAGTIQVFPMYLLGYLAVFPIWTGIRLLMHKSMEEWEESGEQILKTQENDKHYKQERKRRLYFPGKYSKLYYHVLWENFKYHWRDFSFLFVSVLLSAAFLFIGFGMREAFSGSYGYDNELLGLGLTEIMKDCLIVIVLISLFLITVVMVFYRKKRMADDGIFRTLGMRSNAVFWSWIGELLAGFAVALVTAFVIGRAILFGIYAAVIQYFPKIDMKSEVSWKVYLITAIVIAVICLFAFGISGDIHAGERSADARNAAVKSEKIPGIYRKAGALISGLLGVIVLYLYTQRRFSESIFLLCGFFLCLYVFLYNIGAMILRKKETSMDQYLRTLPEEHMIRHRYQTTVKYLTLMIVIHVCVMSFFSVKVVSNRIADKTDTLYPYDYVWLANSNDTGIIEKLKQECKTEVTSVPMVRATTIDNTERLEGPFDLVWQQGQNIGIFVMNEKLEKNENKKTADVLRAENLVRDYVQYGEDGEKKKEIHVLKGLNFSIQRQEFVGIMGRSGCGKTTLLKLLGMIDRQTGGKLFFEEHDTEDLWKDEFADIRRRKIGFVFQDFYLMDSLSVRENIMLPKILDKKSAKECMEESQKYAEQFGITHLMNKKPYELSGGEKQRVAISRALINNPDLILADEPTGNLDSKSGDVVIHTLSHINRELGKTIVMVTHDPKMASYCSRLILLKDGMILEDMRNGGDQEAFYQEILGKMKEL